MAYTHLRWIARRWLMVLLIIASVVLPASAQDLPVVYGLFFYSPTCPHCHEVIEKHWPGIQAEFGDQLKVLFIDASKEQGAQIMQIVRQAMNIESGGVPMLIIGSTVMVGSIQIPMQAPELIRTGLANGGIGYPPVEGIEVLFQAVEAQGTAQDDQANNAAGQNTEIATAPAPAPSLQERLAADPVANALAILVLALLVGSLIVLFVSQWQNPAKLSERVARPLLLVLALIGLGLSLTLAAGAQGELTIVLLAGIVLVMLLILVAAIIRSPRGQPLPAWMIPLTVGAGLIVAGYLAYVEFTASPAVCGTVGDCNAVQQSPYARVLGIPVGVVGLAGYVAILLVWWIRRSSAQPWADRALTVLLVVGVAFSAYLTFLEPFIIGASCAWCLTSAVLMLILFWLAQNPSEAPPRKLQAERVPGLA